MTETAAAPEEAQALSPGAMLAAARERQNLAVAEVARQLRLAPRQIEALEADDFPALPGPIFVRGFVRGYAKLVQTDAEPILEALRRVMPEQPTGSPQPRPLGTPLPEEGAGGSRKRAIMGLLLLVLIPLALFEVFRQSQPLTLPGAPEPIAPEVVPEPPKPVEAPLVAAPPGAAPESAAQGTSTGLPDQSAAQSAPAARDAAPVAPAVEPAVTTEPSPPAAPAPTQATAGPDDAVLRFRFAGESWVEVRDRDGQRVFSKINSPGTEQTVFAEPPVTLVVGNASEVRLTFNDKPVDLAPHTRVNVARFTLE